MSGENKLDAIFIAEIYKVSPIIRNRTIWNAFAFYNQPIIIPIDLIPLSSSQTFSPLNKHGMCIKIILGSSVLPARFNGSISLTHSHLFLLLLDGIPTPVSSPESNPII